MNGVKFSPDNSEIIVEESITNGHMKISVSNSGIGLTKNELDSLFKPGLHPKNKASGHKDGAGFGLMMSQQLSKLIGSTIEVESQPNVKNTFSLTFN